MKFDLVFADFLFLRMVFLSNIEFQRVLIYFKLYSCFFGLWHLAWGFTFQISKKSFIGAAQ